MRRLITIILALYVCAIGWTQTNRIDSLSVELAFQNQDTLKVDTSLELIKSLYNINDFDKALKYLNESEKLSNSIKYEKGQAEIAYYKALIYAQKNDYINAISGYKKSKKLFTTLKDTLGVAKVNNRIGLIEIKRGHYNKGLEYSLSSIKELEKRGLKYDLNSAYSNLASAYYQFKISDRAIEFYLKALKIQEDLNDTTGAYESTSKLAELYSNNKEHRKAIEYYEKILNSELSNQDSVRAKIYPKLGGEYLKFNDYDKATKYLVRGYNANRRYDDKLSLLTVLNNLADLNIKEDRLKIAEKQLTEAKVIALDIDNKNQLLRYYELMKTLDSTKNKFESAFEWQREYYNLKNEITEHETRTNESLLKLEDLSVSDEFDKPLIKTVEPKSEQAKITSNDYAENKKYKLIFYILLAALILVSIFLIVIFLKRNSNIKYVQELEEKNAKIKLQNEAFLEQTKHLESVNNVKDKLFSIVSHDLKDSLSSINGFIDLLRDGSLSREEFDNLIPELSENANNASLLLFNLLNWSKSQMQSLEPKPSLFDIQEVFESKVKLIEQRMENKGITLVDHSLRDFAYADRSMFEIVIQNLLANALKFCTQGDTITISNHISNGSCIVSVADTGIGISKENLNKLFKNSSFTTVGTDNEKGTGLGLSICKELVELNQGKIWVESTQGIGSTFYVQLPKSKSN